MHLRVDEKIVKGRKEERKHDEWSGAELEISGRNIVARSK